MSKGFIIFLVLLLVLGVGFWLTKDYFFQMQEEGVEFQKLQNYKAQNKPITDFLDLVKDKYLGIYGDIQETTFDWRHNDNVISIQGFTIIAKEARDVHYNELDIYFRDNGFVFDISNAADGATRGMMGYKRDNIVCIERRWLIDFTENPNEPIYVNSDKQEITISCGFLNQEDPPDALKSCADRRTCSAGFVCYNSQYSAPSPEGPSKSITGPQEGDLLCHKLCETDADCGIRKCLEKRLFSGDTVEMKKFCD